MHMQLQLHYITQHYTTLHELHCITYNYNCSCNYNCNYHYIALHDTRLHYTNYTTPQLQLQLQVHYTLQLQLHYTTLQLQLQLHYTMLHPAVVGEVTTATIATTPKTQLQPPFGPSVGSLCHPWFTTTNLSYWFPSFETSAAALCGTTGKHIINLIQCEPDSSWCNPGTEDLH